MGGLISVIHVSLDKLFTKPGKGVLSKEKIVGIFDFERAKQYALHRLENELSPDLLYHGIAHTRDEVVPTVEMLATMGGIQGELRALLATDP